VSESPPSGSPAPAAPAAGAGDAGGHPPHPIVDAARARGIPVRRVPGASPPLLLLGHGRKRRLAWRHFTASTSHVGTIASTSKPLAKSLLVGAGLPAPSGAVASDVDGALAIARRTGWPVVVKPVGTDHGVAVFTDLAGEAALREAFAMACVHGPVLVEKHVPGEHVRLLVIGGRCVAAVLTLPARVVGDGRASVAELVGRANVGRADTLSPRGRRIEIDDEARWVLAQQGHAPGSVPRAGELVRLRTASNLSRGGTYEPVTDRVHPENRALAERAARVFELDVAGVDLIVADIARPWQAQPCGIVEVNATPGMIMGGPPGWIEGLWLDTMFPGGDDGRIPVVALLGTQPAVAAALEAALASRGERVALCDARGVRVAGAVRAAGGLPMAARIGAALGDPDASAVLFDFGTDARDAPAAFAGLADAGLDRADVAVVPDGPSVPAVPAQALAAVARVLVTSAPPAGEASRPWVARHPRARRVDPAAGVDALVDAVLRACPGGSTIEAGAGRTVAGGVSPPEEGPDSIGQGAG